MNRVANSSEGQRSPGRIRFGGNEGSTPSWRPFGVARHDGTLYREYRGTINTFSLDNTRLPAINNTIGGAAYVVLNERVVHAAAGWQIEVEREAEKEEGR